MKGYLMSNKINSASFKGQDFFIGIDVHSKNWKVTIRLNHMELNTFSMDPYPDTLMKYLHKNYADGNYFSVYESGFCGYWIHRQLTDFGIHNIIVNPADVPTTDKEKDQKRDPIDSRKLARELENRSLNGIFIPTEKQQAMRAVSRVYYQTVSDTIRLKMRIKSFLYFNGIEIPRKDQINHWSGRFIHWLKNIEFTQQENHYYLNQLITALEQKRHQLLQLLKYIRNMFKDVQAIKYIQSVSGIGFITAFSLYAELMDIKRFNNNNRLASYIGIVPSVEGTGDKEKIKGLTLRHNRYLRKRIIEAAWTAVRKDPALTQRFAELTKRMPKQKAIIRIATNIFICSHNINLLNFP